MLKVIVMPWRPLFAADVIFVSAVDILMNGQVCSSRSSSNFIIVSARYLSIEWSSPTHCSAKQEIIIANLERVHKSRITAMARPRMEFMGSRKKYVNRRTSPWRKSLPTIAWKIQRPMARQIQLSRPRLRNAARVTWASTRAYLYTFYAMSIFWIKYSYRAWNLAY